MHLHIWKQGLVEVSYTCTPELVSCKKSDRPWVYVAPWLCSVVACSAPVRCTVYSCHCTVQVGGPLDSNSLERAHAQQGGGEGRG